MKIFNYTTGLTHAGVFHADDVFATALLKLLNPHIVIKRIMRVPDNLTDDTIVFDIGFGQYDHHQKNGESRSNGVRYAAFGLLWRDFGHLLVSSDSVTAFDIAFIQSLDAADNGCAVNAMYQAISSFAPHWNDDSQTMDETFFNAVRFAQDILQRELAGIMAAEEANTLVQTALMQSDGDVVVLDRFAPWQDVLIPSTAKFVIFPSLRGGYTAQAIPSSIGGRNQKVPFPANWTGAEKEILNRIVTGMSFCHPGRFMIATETLESAMQACRLALQQ